VSWLPPPADDPAVPLRQRNAPGWRIPIELIARKHGLFPCDLEPYEKGETIVWRAGDHVIKLTLPQCAYQIEAEVGCLQATHGKLSVATPALYAQGDLSGWPYLIMTRIGGRPLADFWPSLAHEERLRLAGSLGKLCRELHALPADGFPFGWDQFWREHTANLSARHAAHGGPPALLASIEPFTRGVREAAHGPLLPLHTELSELHVYAEERRGRLELSGLLDFADARVGPAQYELGCLVEFLFRGELGLLREFLLAYGVPEGELTSSYSETLLAWCLCHRFNNLNRTLALVAPWVPDSLEALAARLYALGPG